MYGGQPVSTVSLQQDIDGKACGGNCDLSILSPILICLPGNFRVLKWGQPVVFPGSKVEVLLRLLGLQHQYAAPRELILETLWPGHNPGLGCQPLNSLSCMRTATTASTRRLASPPTSPVLRNWSNQATNMCMLITRRSLFPSIFRLPSYIPR
jgi:hypothetical protein